MKKKDDYYMTNSAMIVELKKYKDTGVISEELGKMFLTIANNYVNKGNFSGYTWKDDMVGEAVCTCVRYVYNFDINKSNNPFAYFTQICYNSFINFIKKQKKHSDIKDICFSYSESIGDIDKAIDYESLKYV